MYHSSGNYEAFARPRKPEGVDQKTAWFVGAGLGNMAAAIFMIRDGQMRGSSITILEELKLPGGALDGIKYPEKGFVIRGGREMEDHMECLWDLFRSVPSLEVEGASVLDEFYWLNKDDPNYSLCRVTERQGQDAHTDKLFTLSERAQREIVQVILATREEMEGRRIDEVFGEDFMASNFWLYWRTMFAFEEWHSALEMKLYLHRFMHHISGLPDLSALKFTKYNQYESLVLPMYRWLLDQGVQFLFEHSITDIEVDVADGRTQATRIDWTTRDGEPGGVDLTEDDLCLVTIGSLTESSDNGDQHTPARLLEGPAPAWDLWRKLAVKSPDFGRPEVFCGDIASTKWESATVTTLDARIPEHIERICQRDPFSGKVVTGGIVTARDSSWLLSWTVNRQPHFKAQKPNEIVVWVYGLFVETPGDFVGKPMQECTRGGDHPGVALPPRCARGRDPGAGRHRRQVRAGDDALRDVVLHAAQGRRPTAGRARGQRQLRLHRAVRRDHPRLHLHNGVLRAHRDGGDLPAARHRARRAGGLQLDLRHPSPAQGDHAAA